MSTIICNNPFTVPDIDLDECIGLSLLKINNSYKDLVNENCLTNEQLREVENNLNNLNSNFASLTAINNQGRYAKAWVTFNGTITPVPTEYSKFNIAKIDRYTTGVYGLSFVNAFPNNNYCLITTTNLVSSNFNFAQPTMTTSTSATINIKTPTGSSVDPEYVSIVIYSL
jgi:hypothetical protein